MRISDWSSDLCSSDLLGGTGQRAEDRPGEIVDDQNEAERQQQLPPDAAFVHPPEERYLEHDAQHHDEQGHDNQGNWQASSEERRVGKEGVSTGRSRWSPYH